MESIARTLTPGANRAIFSTVDATAATGIQTPRKGHKRPLSNVVFLYPPKTQLYFVMVGCIEQPLKRLAGSFAGSLNLIQSTAQRFRPNGRRFIPLQRNTAMNTTAKNPAATSHTPVYSSLFNLIQRTPQGPRVICTDLTFAQASGLVAEIPGALVKFSRMGG